MSSLRQIVSQDNIFRYVSRVFFNLKGRLRLGDVDATKHRARSREINERPNLAMNRSNSQLSKEKTQVDMTVGKIY